MIYAFLLLFFSNEFACAKTYEIKISEKEIYSLQLVSPKKEESGIEIRDKKSVLQLEKSLGRSFAKIEFQGQEDFVVPYDFNQDGIKEFILRTTQPPFIGSLWIFRWNAKAHKFENVPMKNGDNYFPVPLEGKIKLEDGVISFTRLDGVKNSYIWTSNTLELK